MTLTSAKLPVTVAIPVKDEERNLANCLSRLNRFEKVIVVDSGSTDRTCDITREFGAEVVQFVWNGRYPKKRNWFLEQNLVTTDWVLFLDADELVNDAFCDALGEAIGGTPLNGFWLRYNNYFLGRPIRHGVPQRKLALFRVGKALYERIEEDAWSGLDMEIHEHPIVDGEVGEISAPIDHHDDRGVAKFIDRHRHYAQWEASRYLALQAADAPPTHFSERQRRKYAALAKWWFAPSYFLFTYVARLGFLDGGPGFHLAFYKMWYFASIRLLIREKLARSHP